MRILFLDCFTGFTGGKLLGALCDLGVKPSALEWELSKLDLGDFHLHFDRPDGEGIRFGIHAGATHTHDQDEPEGHDHEHGAGCCGGGHADHEHEEEHHHHQGEHEHHEGCCHDDQPEAPEATAEEPHHHHEGDCCGGHDHGHAEHQHEHGHHHHHGEGAHTCCSSHASEAEGRRLGEIITSLEESDLSPFVKEKSVAIFRRIATAQAKSQNGSPEEITLSTADALASVAQIVGTCVGLEQLGVEHLLASPLRGSHLPTLVQTLLSDQAIEPTGETDQTISPVGAGILAELAVSFTPAPSSLVVEKLGHGCGPSKASGKLAAILGSV